MIGSRARVSEVLTGKRNLTLEMVRRVKIGLGISADLLIVDPEKTQRLSGGRLGASAAKPARRRAS